MEALLRQTNLWEVRKQKLGGYSGGMRQRFGVAVALLVFAGEGHGFRRAENIRRALEGELDFYGQVFGFRPHGEIEPVSIANRVMDHG